jgi:hypothetical protein
MPKYIIYISGPISAMPNGNREEFAAAAAHLRKQGFEVINPHELTEGMDFHPERDYEEIMRLDVAEMVLKAREVVTLNGWENSPGATREVAIARLMKIPVSHIVKYKPAVQH